jgi:acetyl/propionyl-CoA carboxylase alpha subunit
VSNNYLNNPKIHAERRLSQSTSEWVRSFACEDMRPLIICRGPIRKEAMDVFDEMGIDSYGILLSEKDSITYTSALAPELRQLTDPNRVHRVPDYTGASKEERTQRIRQIIQIAHENGYNSIFAGYGFMAEDEEMVRSMEDAGLNFIGPCSQTVRGAGLKDEAKRTALSVGVSVTPGVDNATTLTLLKKYPDISALQALVAEQGMQVDEAVWAAELETAAEAVLSASFVKGIDLFTIDELGETLRDQVVGMFEKFQGNRIRLKAISGGGGKGQRILKAPASYEGTPAEQVAQAVAVVPELVREILAEVKCNGVGDNKNVLAELNIETTRHNEIQVVGNGEWCITMGGRDCSLQMHEQKLLEVSVTDEELAAAIAVAEGAGRAAEAKTLSKDREILRNMEEQASLFGAAVGLDSVSTFECIVDYENHFFMEMNTRIQVEHRVTELVYDLEFTNPDNANESFVTTSLVELMVLLARHGKRVPKPSRRVRFDTSVEARLNATNQALQPHAGGMIEYWSDPIDGEIRDDQGICTHNPDTNAFMQYHLAGAYDSNIALLLTTGDDRMASYCAMAEVLRETTLQGKDLATNLEFHYGLVNWFIGNGINARPSTRFIVPYLTAVGLLKQASNNIDIEFAYKRIRQYHVDRASDSTRGAVANALDHKAGMLQRLLRILCGQPHVMAGWLSVNQHSFAHIDGKLTWVENPIVVLANLYHFLNMDFNPGEPAADMIWDHDNELLSNALSFYDTLQTRLGVDNYQAICEQLSGSVPAGFDADTWEAAQAAHEGYRLGTEVLLILPEIAIETGFFELKVNDDLSISIPDRLTDTALQDKMAKVLVPPPVAKSDEILAASGGMFYAREAPDMDVYVNEGDHFNAGDTLYIVEVMKMFNKVKATFAGTIEKVLIDTDGTIIKKGQPLFKVTPDEKIVFESEEDIAARKQKATDSFLAKLAH